MTDFTIIEAPSNLGLKPDSVEHLAGALLDAGLARRLDARRHARLAVPPYDPRRDPDTGILNAARIRDFSIMLADIVGPVVARGGVPGGAGRRLLDPARQPAGAAAQRQAPRAAVPRRPRRFLSAGGLADR